ncbi:hypothetical protein KIW84_044166 [Lathyrus oleraceus]|uniref:NPH3 domain-containing protein n=1 Tax=Pisum sativum TaxID=3888 RepID=A0A9D4XHL6_PEA|nr:hypothetical protein KIW84_044166 [Pisum sativum]
MATTSNSTLQIAMSRSCIPSSQKFSDVSTEIFGGKSKGDHGINLRAVSESSETSPISGLPINLKGKRAFITGVADDNGYGWAIAKSLAVSKSSYDVEVVQKLVEAFVAQEHQSLLEDELQEIRSPKMVSSSSSKIKVAKLVDSYLAEIARDPNLPLLIFVNIVDLVSSFPRQSHDGLYRAIDMYLKEHPETLKNRRSSVYLSLKP